MKTATKKRVGFIVQGAPARHGAKIYSNGEQVGEITSGTLSPSLKGSHPSVSLSHRCR